MIKRKRRYAFGGGVGIYYGITGGYSTLPYEGNPNAPDVPLSEQQFGEGAGEGGGGDGGGSV
jgi:hypothetical protein